MPVLSTLRRTGPPPPRSYPCQGCGQPHNTRQGLAHHYSSKAECRTKRDRKDLEERLDSSDDDFAGSDGQSDTRFNMRDHPSSDSDDSAAPPPRKRTRVTIEDEEEEAPSTDDDVVEISIEEHPLGGKTFGTGEFPMEQLRDFQKEHGIPHTSPFTDDQEYLMYKWLLRAVPSLQEVDNGLKLDIVSLRVHWALLIL